MTVQRKFEECLQQLSTKLEALDPLLAEILQRAQAGEMDVQEAMGKILARSQNNPEWGEAIQREALQAFQPFLEEMAKTPQVLALPDREKFLATWGMSEEDLIYQSGENRLPQIHPLLQGLMAERLQYDGDIPELRVGPLPEGGYPAVPVQTLSRNPVQIGAMLQTAREEVTEELTQVHAAQVSELTKAIQEGDVTALVSKWGETVATTEGYSIGQAPALRVVREPDVFALAAMPFAEKQELFTQALTSTQGRKSATPVITDLIREILAPWCLRLGSHRGPGTQPVLAQARWSVEIFGGKSEMNPSFSYLDVAARALARKLKAELETQQCVPGAVTLYVTPINTVEERIVGWEALLY